MRLFRISKQQHSYDLSGAGGLYYDGRWHKQGTKILYFSEHVSLAKLEVIANSIVRPKNMMLITVSINPPFTIKQINPEDLPAQWNGYPYLESVQVITSKWIESNESLLLKVPSAQAEYESNFLVNPMHPQLEKIEIVSVEPIKFDQRLKF